MSYTKAELETICERFGFNGNQSLPMRLGWCATSMFVSNENTTTQANKVREALRDLNRSGYFQFKS